MLKFFSEFGKRRAVKAYAMRMPRDLAKRYGKRKQYTKGQIKRTVEELRYNAAYICYAYCLFLIREVFDQVHREMGETCDYDVMCREISSIGFGGGVPNADSTLIHYAGSDSMDWSESGAASDVGNSAFDGGGFDGDGD